ncbi:MAG: toprim domain-containing protein, partial [Novosphingobium sp.]|nr:toprim domain-containing protein [Novosphingobium sp.]
DRTPSLSVTIGRQAILFHCFAGCTNADVIAGLGRDGFDACELFDGDHQSDEAPSRPSGPDRNALRLWKQARALAGSPAESYLKRRSIEIASPDLRYHERTPLGPRGEVRFLQAMLAAVRSDAGVIAVHRTFLDSEAATLAPFNRPKRALGSLQTGAVRLAAPRGGHLGLAEGVETALSATQIFGIPCWATLGNERFGTVTIPESVRVLHLFLDADEGGDLAQERGCEAYAAPGRRIVVVRPWRSGYDWADVLHRRAANKARQSARGEEAPA